MPPKRSLKKKGPKKHPDGESSPSESRKKGADRNNVARFLSRFLGAMVSVVVVVAAILLKPLLAESGFFASFLTSGTPSSEIPSDNITNWPRSDPRVGFLVSRACLNLYQYSSFFCHKDLLVSRRHFRAKERIEPGEILFEIPRNLQLWDLDALRDPWIRLHLFDASHRMSGNKVGSEALLAVYLALQIKRKQENSRQWHMEILELAYYDTLFTYEEWLETHPLLDTSTHMKEMLGFSEGFGVWQAYKNMIISEYQAFVDISDNFNAMISYEDYAAARLNVLTRAIRVGPPGPEQAIQGKYLKVEHNPEHLLDDELYSYKEMMGIDLKKDGCIAMVPIADLFNHHEQNNAECEYTKTELNQDGAFVVRSDHRRIEKGFEPMMSYGRRIPDAHLYARYGFVNGDGSGTTQISIAYHHDILKLNMSSQYDYIPTTGLTSELLHLLEKPTAEYLRFDDGYEECIPGPRTHPKEADLKLLKHKHLMMIANMPERWRILMPARSPFAYPGVTHDVLTILEPPTPIEFYTRQNLKMELPLSTCRLMSLTVNDFNGNARKILQDNLGVANFVLEKGNDALEFRAWECLRRWLVAAFVTLEEDTGGMATEYERVYDMNQGDSVGTRDWGAANIRLGELQALKAAIMTIVQNTKLNWDPSLRGKGDYTVRQAPCPEEYQSFLFDEMENTKYETLF